MKKYLISILIDLRKIKLSNYLAFKKIIAFLVVILLITNGTLASANVLFDKATYIYGGNESTVISEQKINNLLQYEFQSRNSTGSTTLVENNKGGFLEFDKLKSKAFSLDSTGVTNYDFSYGKALYDTNIGILDLPNTASGRVTYEAPYYCDLLISSLAKFTKIGNNICLPNYSDFASEYAKNPDRTYINILKTQDVFGADLSRYGILIFPDITLGKHPEILDSIGSGGIAKIKAFVSNGGIVYFSSKSLILADKIGLTDGVIDDNILIKHRTNNGKIKLEQTNDFTANVLNHGLYEGNSYSSKTGSGYYDYLLGSYYINEKTDIGVVPARRFDISNDSNYYFQDLTTFENASLDTSSVVAAFYKPFGKGQIVYNGGNSLFSPQTNSHKLFLNHTLNSILLSFLREVYSSAKVVQISNPDISERLVPALENNIVLKYDFEATNVFNKTVSNPQLNINIATGGLAITTSLPGECILSSDSGSIICSKYQLASGEKWHLTFGLTVTEPTFTQAGKDIKVTSTHLYYTESTGLPIDQNLSNQTVDSVESANMRASLNIDPAGYYPLLGKGVYIDQVLNTENKGSTEATSVDYTVSIPLISPLFEESNQAMLIKRIVFSKEYHNSLVNESTKTNYYPFKNEGSCTVIDLILGNRCKDYVIPKLFPANSVMVDNYDEPVQRDKTDDFDALTQINTGSVGTELGGNILKQSFMPDADILFRHASPRRMVFEYPAKTELLFARQDIYFYNNPAFPLPNGITNFNKFISIEKNNNCTKIPGSYGYPNGVIAGQYPNALVCDPNNENLKWINEKIDYDNLPAGLEKTDYLFPISPENNITNPSELDGFDADGNYIGQKDDNGNTSSAYPIKFIRGSYASFYLPPRSTPKGGTLEFDLPDSVNPDGVFILADHIAITKTEITGNHVKVQFYRGKLPNEQSLKSIIGIALTGINQDISEISLKVSSLKYDLSKTEINTYTEEQKINIDFKKYSFFKLPAVKMKFELPRRKRISEDDIINLNLTEGQINVLFTRPDYYNKSLVFKSNTIGGLSSLLNQAGTDMVASNILTQIYLATPTESYVRKYENLEPFVRFGTYIQELAYHRTVWGTAEDHPINDPGIMANSAMFGNVGNVGINPIPFREYLTTGKSQIIPLATENARVDYKDIFGRQFAAPIRTTVPEAVPLPPPVRNFQMNTTYEMYDKNGNIKTTWDGEEELEIRQNIKVYNNYPKFFDPTICPDNQSGPYYGGCWDNTGSVVTGYKGETNYSLLDKVLDSIDFYWIKNVKLFSTKALYESFMTDLQTQLTASGLTDYKVSTLKRAGNNVGNISLATGEFIDDKAHNYSPEVEKYYPQDYIANNMWNLTHFDYDDSVYSKGYPYHMDNQLPNPHATDYWNPAKELPHNIIAVPIFRGVGYKMKYFGEEPGYLQYETENSGKIESNITPYTSWKYPTRKGWWPENLQNKDATLLAGQSSINNIPYEVSGNEYLKPNLINTSNFEQISGQNNIYSCLFNPFSLIDIPAKFQYKANVLINNVIPIIPWIQKENENANFLTSYNCNTSPYTENTMNKVNNIVETENAYWLYFASNLRGEAKEALNVVNRIMPYPGRVYEGDTKVIEGGRFVYWNPALGPNAFEIVDSPVAVIKTENSFLAVDKELIPYNLKNYKTDAYLLYTVKDPGEIMLDANGKETPRKWKDEIYTDSRGDGNYSASVYVGSSYNKTATKALMDPGETSLVRIDLYNNSGYDWEMIGQGSVANDNGQFKTTINGGIDFTIVGNQPLNANDIMSKVARNVLKPDKFNFITFTIPDEIKPYITITPSDANILTPGTFFDFDFVNVTTVRDGFKGSYFVDLKVDPSIPDNLRAKIYSIKAKLNTEYFKHIPSPDITKDPVKWGVIPNVPDLKFAVADANNNAYYRSGYSTGITLDVAYNSGFTFDKAYEINELGVNAMRLAAGDGTLKHQRLRETFENITSSGYSIREMNGTSSSSGELNKLSVDFNNNGISEFPYINSSGTIIPKSYILVHLKKDSLNDGEHTVEVSDSINYSNYAGRSKNSINILPLTGYAQGPKLDISYKSALIGNNPGDNLEIQKLVEGENKVEMKLYIKNTGSDIAFDPSFTINVASGVNIDNSLTQNASINGNVITFKNLFTQTGTLGQEGEAIGPGITNYFPVYLTYSGSYNENPVNLIDSASYEFRPYDPILPALSGSFSTGFALDYVKTNVEYLKFGSDEYNLTMSGNTVGIYWDITDGTGNLDSKITNTGSEILNQSYFLDSTISHNLIISSYFKTKTGTFKKLKDFNIVLSAEAPYIRYDSKVVANGNSLKVIIKTNKLGKYNGYFEIIHSQGDGFSGKILSSNNGNLEYNLSEIDITKDTTFEANLYSGDTFLTGITFVVPGELPSITESKADRKGDDSVKVSFKTNKAKNTCFNIYKDGNLLSDTCIKITGESSYYNDTGIDVFKDSMYRIEIFENNGNSPILVADIPYISPNPDTSSIPLKIFESDIINSDITFNKVKDFSGIYLINGTPIRYAIKIKTPGKPYLSQFSEDKTVEVRYASGQVIYAGENWDFTLNQPVYLNNNSSDDNNYEIIKTIELGDPIIPFVFSEYNMVIINNIWQKPDKVTAIHYGITSQVPECDSLPKIKTECWQYDVNKVNIYTKKFSKYILSKLSQKIIYSSGLGGGGGSNLSMDYCPAGDKSYSYYDRKCSDDAITDSNSFINNTNKKNNLPITDKIIVKKFNLFSSSILSSYNGLTKQFPHKVTAELNRITKLINKQIDIKYSSQKERLIIKNRVIDKLNEYGISIDNNVSKRYIKYITRKLNES